MIIFLTNSIQLIKNINNQHQYENRITKDESYLEMKLDFYVFS